jgi:KDO2-lipid IV(A) lauroyltransferase
MSGMSLKFQHLLFHILVWALRVSPRRVVLRIGQSLGSLMYQFDKKHRSIALSNLDTAFGSDLSQEQLEQIAKNSFLHYGRVFMDMIHLSRLRPEKRDKLITMEGEEYIHAALQKGRGVLLFSAHFGLWELAPAHLAKIGRLNVVARPLDNPYVEQDLSRMRQRLGAHVIYKYQAYRPILRSLRANEIVAILIDQNVLQSEAVFVDFFGKMAATTPSLATFHLRTQAPIIPGFCYPTGTKGYHIKVMKPLEIPLSGDNREDITRITQVCTRIIENQIRELPDFWFWFHNRWKTQPKFSNSSPAFLS